MAPMSEHRSRLARSEAAAAGLLALSMHDQGNSAARTQTFSGGQLVSLGPQRYVNRLLCTELTLSESDLDRTIAFFTSREMSPSIQISSLADPDTTDMLRKQGFTLDWQRSVLAGPTTAVPGRTSPVEVAIAPVYDDELDEWLSVLAKGNNALSPAARTISDEFGRAAHGISGAIDLLARVDGRAVACGSLQPVDGVGWLGGAATIPEFRRRGLQQTMLNMRIDIAGEAGCELVAATAVPDSSSMRNLERAGLVLVDIQNVWTLRP